MDKHFALKIYLLFREKMFMLCLFTGRLVKIYFVVAKDTVFILSKFRSD